MNNQSTKNSSRFGRRVFLLAAFLVPSVLCLGFYYLVIREPLKHGKEIFVKLPHYGPAELSPNGIDSIFYQLPEFEFINQEQESVGINELSDKVYSLNFFCTNCDQISSKLAAQFFIAQKKLHYLRKDFRMLSLTTQPEIDTPEVLKIYSNTVHAKNDLWSFMTGDKAAIQQLANAEIFRSLPEEFSQKSAMPTDGVVLLIDRERQVRGIYDGTSLKDMQRFINEVVVLCAEYGRYKNKS
jgi:protein SCO1